MNVHYIELADYNARAREGALYLGTKDSYGIEQLHITPGPGWTGLSVLVTFNPPGGTPVSVTMPASGIVDVPAQATASVSRGERGAIVFSGASEGVQRITTDLYYSILSHSFAEGSGPVDNPSIWDAVSQARSSADSAKASASQAQAQATVAGNAAKAAEATKNALAEAVATAGGTVIDPTLTVPGAAAEAKATASTLERLARAAIRPIVTGNPALCENSAAWGLQGLKLYGKSTQDGTPSPENPVPVVSAGDSGTIQVSVKTHQLLDNTDGEKRAYKLPEPLKPGTYTVSFDSDSTRGGFRLSKTTDTSADSVVSTKVMSAGNGRLYLTVTTSFDASFINISSDGATFVENIMLNAGGSPLPFEPYQSQSLSISTPSGLAGIPVTSGGNYADAEGQQWVCDSIDYGAGKYWQRCKKFVFDGSADEGWQLLTDGNEGRFRYVSRYSIGIADSTKTSNRSLNSNFAIGAQGATVNTDDVYTIVDGGAIYVSTNGSDSLETFQSYLASNPMTLIGVLLTPIETDIPAEELAACRALTTYDGTTVVSTLEDVSGMEVRYVADGTRYLQSVTDRIAALEAAQSGIA